MPLDKKRLQYQSQHLASVWGMKYLFCHYHAKRKKKLKERGKNGMRPHRTTNARQTRTKKKKKEGGEDRARNMKGWRSKKDKKKRKEKVVYHGGAPKRQMKAAAGGDMPPLFSNNAAGRNNKTQIPDPRTPPQRGKGARGTFTCSVRYKK